MCLMKGGNYIEIFCDVIGIFLLLAIGDAVLDDLTVGLGGHVPDDASGREADVREGHVGWRTGNVFKSLNLHSRAN